MSRLTLKQLRDMKSHGEKIAVLTAYDASFASLLDDNGVDVLLVGDSLGMVCQGHDSTLPVSMDDMAYHCANVVRGSQRSYIIVDLPYQSYTTVEQTVENSRRLLTEGGAQMVKLEGGQQQITNIEALVEQGIPVCGHLGLEPQSVHEPDGYKVQGRDEDSAARILNDAKLLQQAGIQLLVLECIPASLGKLISATVSIPVIGIGAGVECDGQVLVTYDMLGISRGHKAKFVKNFLQGQSDIESAVRAYVDEVKQARYPAREHSYQ